jgi:cephalosporin-C deacetylase-like acetyl esterase
MRGVDYLTSLPEVDASRIGCVGNSGGGTLTAYIGALDPRISAAAICCYITTLSRRMGNRIQEDPAADPEQDIFGFVSEKIDHAGLLALRVPRPTLLGAAILDFFPIAGTRESFAEAKQLYETAGASDRIKCVEAPGRHGLSRTLRLAVYDWFDRWLLSGGGDATKPVAEYAVAPRPEQELLVCRGGQASVAFQSRPLLPLTLDEFERNPKRDRVSLRTLLRLDPELSDFRMTEIAAGTHRKQTVILCVNGNETPDWRDERRFLQDLAQHGYAILAVDPRGVGALRPKLSSRGNNYADPLEGVEENIAYNAFLVGKSLLGMRVTDVVAAVQRLGSQRAAKRVVVYGRRDSALTALLAAAIEPSIGRVAVEDLIPSFRSLFRAEGHPINAASILPGLLQGFGDVAEVLAQLGRNRVLVAGATALSQPAIPSAALRTERFTSDAKLLIDWLGE